MQLAAWFWAIFVITALLGIAGAIPATKVPPWTSTLILWVLVGILGWGLFQSPVKG